MATTVENDNGEMIVKRVSVPIGLEELMEGLTKEVILKKPKDIYVFASEYFAHLLAMREKGTFRGIPVKRAQSLTKQYRKNTMLPVADKKSKSVDATGKAHTSRTDESALKKTLSVKKIDASPPAPRDNVNKGQNGNKSKAFLDKRKARKASTENFNKTVVSKEPSKESTPRSISSDKSSEKKTPTATRGARDRSISGNNRKARAKSEDEKSRTPRQGSQGPTPRNIRASGKLAQKSEEVVTKKIQKSKSNDVKTGIAETLVKGTVPLLVEKQFNDKDKKTQENFAETPEKVESSLQTEQGLNFDPKSEVEEISQLSPVQESPILASKDPRNHDDCIGCALKAQGAVDLKNHVEKEIDESVTSSHSIEKIDEENSKDSVLKNAAKEEVDQVEEIIDHKVKTGDSSILENIENEILQNKQSDDRKKRSVDDDTHHLDDTITNEMTSLKDIKSDGNKAQSQNDELPNEDPAESENVDTVSEHTSVEITNKEKTEKEEFVKESSTVDVSDNKTTTETTKSAKESVTSNLENTEKRVEENVKVHVNDKNQEITTTISTIVEKIEESASSEIISSEEIIKVTEEILPDEEIIEGTEEIYPEKESESEDSKGNIEFAYEVDKDTIDSGITHQTDQIEITEQSEIMKPLKNDADAERINSISRESKTIEIKEEPKVGDKVPSEIEVTTANKKDKDQKEGIEKDKEDVILEKNLKESEPSITKSQNFESTFQQEDENNIELPVVKLNQIDNKTINQEKNYEMEAPEPKIDQAIDTPVTSDLQEEDKNIESHFLETNQTVEGQKDQEIPLISNSKEKDGEIESRKLEVRQTIDEQKHQETSLVSDSQNNVDKIESLNLEIGQTINDQKRTEIPRMSDSKEIDNKIKSHELKLDQTIDDDQKDQKTPLMSDSQNDIYKIESGDLKIDHTIDDQKDQEILLKSDSKEKDDKIESRGLEVDQTIDEQKDQKTSVMSDSPKRVQSRNIKMDQIVDDRKDTEIPHLPDSKNKDDVKIKSHELEVDQKDQKPPLISDSPKNIDKLERRDLKISQNVDDQKDIVIPLMSESRESKDDKIESKQLGVDQTIDKQNDQKTLLKSDSPKNVDIIESRDMKIDKTVDDQKAPEIHRMPDSKEKDNKIETRELEVDQSIDDRKTPLKCDSPINVVNIESRNLKIDQTIDDQKDQAVPLMSDSKETDNKIETRELEVDQTTDETKNQKTPLMSDSPKNVDNIEPRDLKIDQKDQEMSESQENDVRIKDKDEKQELTQKTEEAQIKPIEENVDQDNISENHESVQKDSEAYGNEEILPNEDKTAREINEIKSEQNDIEETSISENAIATDISGTTDDTKNSKEKYKIPLAENALKAALPTAAVAGIVQAVDSKLSAKEAKPKDSIRIKNTKSRASSHEALKTKEASEKDAKEKAKIKRIKSVDTLSNKPLSRTKSKQKLLSSANKAEDSVVGSSSTKHQKEEKSKNSPRSQTDNKEIDSKPSKRSKRSASIDAVNQNKEVNGKTLKPQSSFDSSKLKEELKQAEDIGKKSTFKSNFNPLALRQEIKKASEGGKEGNRAQIENVIGPVAAALKIQSVWRGFLVRKNKSKEKGIFAKDVKDADQQEVVQEIMVNSGQKEETPSDSHGPKGTNGEVSKSEDRNVDVKLETSNQGTPEDKSNADVLTNDLRDDLIKEKSHELNQNHEETSKPEITKEDKNEESVVNIHSVQEDENVTTKSGSSDLGNEVEDKSTSKFGDPSEIMSFDKGAITDFITFEKDNVFRDDAKSRESNLNSPKLSQIEDTAKTEEPLKKEKTTSSKIEENTSTLIPNVSLAKIPVNIDQKGDTKPTSAKSENIQRKNEFEENHKKQNMNSETPHPSTELELEKIHEKTEIKNDIRPTMTDKITKATDLHKEDNENKEELKMANAVLKIQALWRGFNVRRLKKRGELFGTTTEFEEEKQKEVLKPQEKRGPKVHSSASKIQAVWRGYKVRKNIKEVNSKLAELQKPEECDEMPGQRGPTDEDIMRAAVKIQAGARGYMVRKKANKNRLKSISEESPKNENKSSDDVIVEAIKLLDEVPVHSPDKKWKEPEFDKKSVKTSAEISENPRSQKLKTNSIDENNGQDQNLEGVIINNINENVEENNNLTTIEEEVKEAIKAISTYVPEEVERAPKNTANDKITQRENDLDDNKKDFTTDAPPEFSNNKLYSPKTTDLKPSLSDKKTEINGGSEKSNYETAPTRPVTTDDTRKTQEDSNVNGLNKTESRDANQNKQIDDLKNADHSDENNVNLSIPIATEKEKLLNEINDKITKSKLEEDVVKHKENNLVESENNQDDHKDGDATADEEQKRPLSLESTTSRDSAITVIYNHDSEADEETGEAIGESHESIPWVETESEINEGRAETRSDGNQEQSIAHLDQKDGKIENTEIHTAVSNKSVDGIAKPEDDEKLLNEKGIPAEKAKRDIIDDKENVPSKTTTENSTEENTVVDKAAVTNFISFERSNTFRRDDKSDLSKLKSDIQDAAKIEDPSREKRGSSVKEKSASIISDPSLAKSEEDVRSGNIPGKLDENQLNNKSKQEELHPEKKCSDGNTSNSVQNSESTSKKEDVLSKEENSAKEKATERMKKSASTTKNKNSVEEDKISNEESDAELKQKVIKENKKLAQKTDSSPIKEIDVSKSLDTSLAKPEIKQSGAKADSEVIENAEKSFLGEGLKEKVSNFVKQVKFTPTRDKDLTDSSNKPGETIIQNRNQTKDEENIKESTKKEVSEDKSKPETSAISSSAQVKITPKDYEANNKLKEDTGKTSEWDTGKKNESDEVEDKFDLGRLRKEIESTLAIAEMFTNSDKLKDTKIVEPSSNSDNNKVNISLLKEEIKKVDENLKEAKIIDKYEVEKEIEHIDQTIDLVDKEIDEVLQNLKEDPKSATKREITISPKTASPTISGGTNSDELNNKIDREKWSEEIEHHVQDIQNYNKNRSEAATVIQSNYRGYKVRKDLQPGSLNVGQAIGIPLRELSDIKEEDTDLKSSSTGSLEDLHTDSYKDSKSNKSEEDGLKKIEEHYEPQEIVNEQSQKGQEIAGKTKEELKTAVVQVSAGDQIGVSSINLVHTSEFHDTIMLPLPVTPPLTTMRSSGEGASPDSAQREEEFRDQVRPVSVQLNEAPPAGAAFLTSPKSDDDHGGGADVDGDGGGQRKIAAQASDKDASATCAAQSDNKMPGSSMDSEKRNNNAAVPKKNMEVEAATKIQAGFRGYQVRKQLKNKIGAPGDINNQRRSARRKSSGRLGGGDSARIALKSINNKNQSKGSDIEEKSAVKIQAGIRGFLVRRRQKNNKKTPMHIIS